MKKIVIFFLFVGILLFGYTPVIAQIIDPVKKIKKVGVNRINKNISKGINKGFDNIEDGASNLIKNDEKNKETKDTETNTNTENDESNNENSETTNETSPILNWAKYDFVPGDKVIFEDNLIGEENGEFPSRWDLKAGNAEIAEFGGENIIMFRDGQPSIMPYFKDEKKDYLPDVFTIEFDLYTGKDLFQIYLYNIKTQSVRSKNGYTSIRINNSQMKCGSVSGSHPDEKKLPERRWAHIAIAYTNGKLKVYMDETRILNIPRLDFNPSGLSLHSYSNNEENTSYIKNIRIAEGGVKYYDRVMQDGKIIANGIRFDVNKSILKPESMGVINNIFDLMNKNKDINFSVEGHTDSDGNDAFNQKLSEDRAQTVVNTLIKLGISPDRLSYKGMGESQPIESNNTPEGKASNRRVEFIKI